MIVSTDFKSKASVSFRLPRRFREQVTICQKEK